MKFLHLGDLHIGKIVHGYSMIEDQIYILEHILKIAKEHKVDAVLIAGDVYDKSIPSEEAVGVLDSFLCQLAESGILTYIISGNHDSDERLHFGSRLFTKQGIYIAAKYDGKLCVQSFKDAYGTVNLYLLPFVKRSQVQHFYPDEEIDSYDKAVRVALASADIKEGERNVLLAHQFVVGGGAEPRLGGSENATVQNVGTVEKVSADCFAPFDYVALGHIHSPQKIGREEVRYAGSPLKYSLSEIDNEKSIPLVTLEEKGKVTIKKIPLEPLRDMRHLTGKLEQLLDADNIKFPEDYIYVTLTDEDAIPEAMTRIREHYPYTMKIDYDNIYTRNRENIQMAEERKQSFSELIADFYSMMYGEPIGEEEMKLMMEVAGEAGVISETD